MEDVRILKYTIRGLNYRYNALKKISSLIGESENEQVFLDNVLGVILELMEVECGVVLGLKNSETASIITLRAQLPLIIEKKLKKTIEKTDFPVAETAFTEAAGKEKNVYLKENPEIENEYRKSIKEALKKIDNVVVVPVRINKRIVAVIELYNLMHKFGKDRQEALESIAGEIGASLELFRRISALRSKTKSLKSLTQITEAISAPYQLNTVLDIIMKSSLGFFEAEGCSILLKDKEGRPEFVAVSGSKADQLKGKKLNKGEGVVGWVIEENKPILVGKVQDNKKFSPRIDSMTKMITGSIICAPLKVLDDVIGVVEIVRSIEQQPFNEEDLSLLVILSSHASIAVDKARLYTLKERWLRSTIELLGKTIDTKDKFFPDHTRMVRENVRLIGEEMNLNEEELQYLDMAAAVQDIGKLIIPENILGKEGELTEQEWEVVKSHPLKSIEILQTVEEFREIIPIIKYHHEKYDGSGYPEGLEGEDIPKYSRILAAADAYAALVGRRPYRESLSPEAAQKVLKKQKGRQFDPKVVDAFLNALNKK